MLGYLQDADRGDVDYPERTVLVAEELTASALGEIPRDKLVGIVSMRGSANSHTAYWRGRWASPQLLAWRTCL